MSSPSSAAFRTSWVSAASFAFEVISLCTSFTSTVRSGVSVAFLRYFPEILSLIGEIGGMNSDILKMFSIALFLS